MLGFTVQGFRCGIEGAELRVALGRAALGFRV